MIIPKKTFVIVITVVAVIVFAAAAMPEARRQTQRVAAQMPWYAVHLTNNNIYFGHLASVSADTIALADTYYLEAYTMPADKAASSTSFRMEQAPQQIYNLARRGEGNNMQTDNTLFIDRRAVLFWEKLSPGAKMAQWLAKAGEAR